MENFLEILTELIDGTGLSLRQLAADSRVTAMQYSRYLRGQIPTIEVTMKIAKYFNCSLDYLFGLDEKKNGKKYNGYDYDMTDFVKKYKSLLKINNTNNYRFSLGSIFNESILRHWKEGSVPRLDVVYEIASKLGASMDELVGRK